jgi:two-component system response regulator FlrC
VSNPYTQRAAGNAETTSAVAAPRRRVLVIGRVDSEPHDALAAGLHERRQRVVSLAHCDEVGEPLLADAALVFVFVGAYPGAQSNPAVAALVRRAPTVNVVPIVEYADQACAATLLEAGCVDYLLAPFSTAQLDALLHRQQAARAAEGDLVSRSQSSRRLLAMAQRVAVTRAPILISGETGTGKELLARYIHRFGSGEQAPFVAVNCAAIPEQMLESLLFGHERGAFTGAVSTQVGKFEQANGGTLLLDEIGELPLGLQAKLLRVLQEQRVERLGAQREIALNVRVIAATHRDLRVEAEQGRFRADLMFRLDVLPLHIAPLRERRDDILPLAQRFIERYAPGECPEQLLIAQTRQALLGHTWPGNVRELENCLQRALILRNGLFIQPRDLGLDAGSDVLLEPPPSAAAGHAALKASGKWAEYQHVIDTLRRFGGHKSKAALSLGMSTRALRYRLSAMRAEGIATQFTSPYSRELA